MMLSPSERPHLDTDAVSDILGDAVLRSSEDMVEFMYNDVKLTLYPNGSMMFYHFTDLDTATSYMEGVMEKVKAAGKIQ